MTHNIDNSPRPNTNAVQDEVAKDLTPVLGGEPAIVISIIVGAIVALVSALGILDITTATTIVSVLAPVVAGIITRFNVKPVKKTL